MPATELFGKERREGSPHDEELELTLVLFGLLIDEKIDAKTRYTEFTECQEALPPKIRAILKYCVNYEFKPDVHSTEITVVRDPREVFERLSEFERATMDPAQTVILPPSNPLGSTVRTPYLLSGGVNYTLNPCNFWQITVGDASAPPLEVINVHRAIYSEEEWEQRTLTLREIGHTPLVGHGTVRAYLSSRRVPAIDRSQVRRLIERSQLSS